MPFIQRYRVLQGTVQPEESNENSGTIRDLNFQSNFLFSLALALYLLAAFTIGYLAPPGVRVVNPQRGNTIYHKSGAKEIASTRLTSLKGEPQKADHNNNSNQIYRSQKFIEAESTGQPGVGVKGGLANQGVASQWKIRFAEKLKHRKQLIPLELTYATIVQLTGEAKGARKLVGQGGAGRERAGGDTSSGRLKTNHEPAGLKC